ncbi:phosphoribosyltransferase [Jatrophihabitans sp.]|uniref:phosphoribosyltransferase n=1 Tax=Jatrophihabitans sp. TaxID=1932789 RepID=UPI002F16BBE1
MLHPSGRQRRYLDRVEAGTVLADQLAQQLAGDPALDRLLVLGLPRGGIPVADRVARKLGAPLDVLLVRKVGLPEQPELAMGAVAAIGDQTAVVRNEPVLRQRRVPPAEFAAACRVELEIMHRQALRYRGAREPLELAARSVIVVDDGLATGATMRAAVATLRATGVGPLVLAVPIGSPRTCQALAGLVDTLVCPWQPPDFGSVSQGYQDFGQVSEATVIRILAG